MRVPSRLQRAALALARHRLVHFFAIAAVFFALAPREPGPGDIAIDRGTVALIYERAARASSSPLTREDKQRALDAWVEEEILYREGVRRGLEREDEVARARVVRRMLGYAEDAAGRAAPLTDEEIARHYAAHPERWHAPPRARFDWVFVGSGSGVAADAKVAAVRRALANDPDASPESLGDSGPLARGAPWALETEVTVAAGRAVADAVFRGPVGAWSPPLVSTYGFYFVRVRARDEARTPPFDEARAAVVADLGRERSARGAEELLAKAARSYRIRVDAPAGEPSAPSLTFEPRAARALRAAGGP